MRLLLTLLVAVTAFAASASAQSWQRLVEPDALASLDDVVIVDIRDRKAYLTGHVPGAVNAPYPTWRGPASNPGEPLSDEALTLRLTTIGITPSSRAVVTHAGTDQTDFGAAARVYWTLKSAGLEEIAILNGGVRGWIADGRNLSVDPVEPTPSSARFTLSDEWAIDRDGVAAIMGGEREGTLVDARPAAFFEGEAKHPAAPVAGTLAGAMNAPFERWFEGNATAISGGDAAKALAADIKAEGETVSFCNTGHWAATNWFALSELAGNENVKLYPESVVGWIGGGGEVAKGE